MSIIRSHSKGWEAVPRAPFEDQRLSLVTRGVLAWLLTRPENWEVRVSSMLRLLPISEFIWQKTVSPELQSAGYLIVSRSRDGGRWVWEYHIFSFPSGDISPVSETEATIPKEFKDGEIRPEKLEDKKDKSSYRSKTHNHYHTHGCVFLGGLPPELQDPFRRIAYDLPLETQQDIADELAGQLRAGKVRRPESLMHRLIRAWTDGTLTLDFARLERKCRATNVLNNDIRGKSKEIELDPDALAKGLSFLGTEAKKRLTRRGAI